MVQRSKGDLGVARGTGVPPHFAIIEVPTQIIRRVAVLGAGTMGARIAARFANAGEPALLLDVVIPGQPNRNAAALKGIENALKLRPGGFFTDDAETSPPN